MVRGSDTPETKIIYMDTPSCPRLRTGYTRSGSRATETQLFKPNTSKIVTNLLAPEIKLFTH